MYIPNSNLTAIIYHTWIARRWGAQHDPDPGMPWRCAAGTCTTEDLGCGGCPKGLAGAQGLNFGVLLGAKTHINIIQYPKLSKYTPWN